MKATKIVPKEKNSSRHYFILKIFYNKDHLAFLWENYKNDIYSKHFQYTFRCYLESRLTKVQLLPK